MTRFRGDPDGYESIWNDPTFLEEYRKFQAQQRPIERWPGDWTEPEAHRESTKYYKEATDRAFAAEARFMEAQERAFRRRQSAGRRPTGLWQFTEIHNTSGGLTGWSVTLDGQSAGLALLRGDDIWVLSSPEDVAPGDVMAAFLKLYPGGVREAREQRVLASRLRLLAERAERGEEAVSFGPPRDWSEEE